VLLERLDREAHIWTAIPESVRAPEDIARLRATLSGEERERMQRLQNAEDAHRYLVSHAMLRQVLSRYVAIAPHQWRFRYGPHGRPELAGPATTPLRFNLTHTTGLAACIVSTHHACGIDAEQLRERHRPLRVARRMFSDREYAELEPLTGRHFLEYFYSRWTLREAYVKAVGIGISFPTRTLDFSIDAKGSATIDLPPEVGRDGRDWRLQLFRPTGDHLLAIALQWPPGASVSMALGRLDESGRHHDPVPP
jgi:4'-phosphopantetheinyl transferase